jgi:surfeit locus 1 family protein
VTGDASKRPLPGIVAPTILTVALLAALLGLGNWQLDRKAWKEGLIDTLDRRLADAPAALPPAASWQQLTAAADEYRRVQFRATLVPHQEALVFTSGSTFRPDVEGPGYWVLAPARLADGGVVVVNRGFVPEGRQDAAAHDDGGTGPLDLVGVMRWPELPGWFTPQPDQARNIWFARDQLAIATADHWGEVAPFYVEQESPQPPGGLPQPGPLKVNLPDDHLQYAITWFGLAAVLAGTFAFWLRSRRRETKGLQ